MFDPYHKWLGIQPGRRPPTHYQLLGIAPTETDVEVIEEAFIRQTTHLRSYQNGPQALECTKLLNELAQAHVALTDPAKRRQYDSELEEERAYLARGKIKPYSAPLASEQAPAKPAPRPKATKPKRNAYPELRRKAPFPVVPVVAAVGLTAAVVLGLLFFLNRGKEGKAPRPEVADRGGGQARDRESSRAPEATPPSPPSAPESSAPTESTPPSRSPIEESKPAERPSAPPVKPPIDESNPPKSSTPPPAKPDDPPPNKPDDKSSPILAKVDLLKLITPIRPHHVVKGRWAFVGKALASPLDPFARIQIPYVPPDEYDLHMVAERKQGNDTLCIALVLPGMRTFINLDASPSLGYFSGLQGIDGVPLMQRSEGSVRGSVIARGKNTIDCKVRRQELTVNVNGRDIVHYTGDFRRLESGGEWGSPNERAILLGTWKTSYHITAIELTPLTEPGRVLD